MIISCPASCSTLATQCVCIALASRCARSSALAARCTGSIFALAARCARSRINIIFTAQKHCSMKTIKRLFAPLLKLNVASLLTLVGIGACAQNPGYKTLNADEFEKAIADKSVVLIDVRTAAEYAQGHLPDAALNIDVLEENFAAKVKSALQSSSAKTSAGTSGNASASDAASTSGSTSASPSKSATTVAIYCRSGRRSKNAAAILAKEGYKVIELAGGFNSWTSAGKPSVRGTSAE